MNVLAENLGVPGLVFHMFLWVNVLLAPCLNLVCGMFVVVCIL